MRLPSLGSDTSCNLPHSQKPPSVSLINQKDLQNSPKDVKLTVMLYDTEWIQIKVNQDWKRGTKCRPSVILSLQNHECITLLASVLNSRGSISYQGSSKPLVFRVFTGAHRILPIRLAFSLQPFPKVRLFPLVSNTLQKQNRYQNAQSPHHKSHSYTVWQPKFPGNNPVLTSQ